MAEFGAGTSRIRMKVAIGFNGGVRWRFYSDVKLFELFAVTAVTLLLATGEVNLVGKQGHLESARQQPARTETAGSQHPRPCWNSGELVVQHSTASPWSVTPRTTHHRQVSNAQ